MMNSDGEERSPPGYIYSKIVHLICLPFIHKFLGGVMKEASDVMHLEVTPIQWKKTYGGRSKENNNNNDDKVMGRTHSTVSMYIDNPVHFCWMMILDPKLGMGETYMAGDWRSDPNPTDLLKALIRAKHEVAKSQTRRCKSVVTKLRGKLVDAVLYTLNTIWWAINYIQHKIKENSINNAAKNIRDHYDLGNDMFELFLDKSMTYSCAVFENPGHHVEQYDRELLEEAQIRKIDSLIDTLDLTPQDHVLEIGCGWGACGIRAVQKYGCKWTGLTISHEQLEWAQNKVKEAGLQSHIEFKYLDYRLETGLYSKLISIEMIEAVGESYLAEYFKIINDRLVPGGKAVLQAITCPDAYYARYCNSSDFIKKHIFPGGHLPSIGHLLKCLPHGLRMGDRMSRIGRHYSTTLDYWFTAWMNNRDEILSIGYSETFHRKWQFYFALCSSLFAYDHIETIQFNLHKTVY